MIRLPTITLAALSLAAAFAATLSTRNRERLKELSTKVGARALTILTFQFEKERVRFIECEEQKPGTSVFTFYSATTEIFIVAVTSAARRTGIS